VVWEGGRATRPPYPMYARHGRLIGGGSPLGEAVVLTPSRRQRRHREVGSGGSPRRDLCTEEHEPRMRRSGLGEPARHGEARHHQQGWGVDAAAVEGHQSFLSGEACPGVSGEVAGDGRRWKVAADRAGVSRGRSTGRGTEQPGRAERQVSGLPARLVPGPVIAAIPRTRACRGRSR
jgi:hypothetical protein